MSFHDQIANTRRSARFPLQVPDYVKIFKQRSNIPPAKSATRNLALRTSLVYIGEWNGVFQAQSN
jgi:hypothetical protein